MWNQAKDLISGACDLHVHAGPDVVVRQHDLIEVAQEASASGMKALAFKDHNTTTADRVKLAQKLVGDDLMLIGGIVLNYAVGGFNPELLSKHVNGCKNNLDAKYGFILDHKKSSCNSRNTLALAIC